MMTFGEAGGGAPIDDVDAADRPRGEEEGMVVGQSISRKLMTAHRVGNGICSSQRPRSHLQS